VLARLADAESLKDHQENEEIVYAERGFNKIAACEFKRGLAALRDRDPGRKAGRSQHQNGSPEPCKSLRVARRAPVTR